MGFFSDPAAANIEIEMDALSLGYETSMSEDQLQSPAGTPTGSKRSVRTRPRRNKSCTGAVAAVESPRMPTKVRNLPRRSKTLGSSGPFRNRASSSRRESTGDSSLGSGGGSMHDHLVGIEAFCQVMKEAGSKERKRMLRESLKERQGSKSKINS